MYYHYVPLTSSHSPALVAIVFPIKARTQLHSNHLAELARVEAAGMAKFACTHCEHTYAHRRNLKYNMKSKHPNVSVERKVRGAGKKVKPGLGFKSDQCGYLWERRSLDRHVARNHTDNPAFNCDQCRRSYSRSGNLEMHKRTCTGPIVAPAPKRPRTASAVPEFTVRRRKRALGGTSEMYEVDMKESDNLTALQAAVTSFQPSIPT